MNHHTHIMSNILIFSVVIGTVALLIWANFSSLDVVSRAHGVVIPSSKTQIIQSPDGGVIDKILVKEGDVVEKGTLLVQLDKIRANAVYQETLAKKASLEAAVARLKAEVSGEDFQIQGDLTKYPDIADAELALYTKRKSALEDDLRTLETSLALTKRELRINEPLLKSGEVSEVDVLRLRRQVNDIQGSILQRRNKFLSDAQVDLVKAVADLTAQNEILSSRENMLQQTDVVSPIRGVVKNIKFSTEGGVVRPAEDIMQIVPIEEELMLEIKINPADIAYLREGQKASVKMEAYSYTTLDNLDGELTYISPDTLKDESTTNDIRYYKGHIKITTKRSGQADPNLSRILPGMTATVDIKIGRRTVLEYILKPVMRGLSSGLKER